MTNNFQNELYVTNEIREQIDVRHRRHCMGCGYVKEAVLASRYMRPEGDLLDVS